MYLTVAELAARMQYILGGVADQAAFLGLLDEPVEGTLFPALSRTRKAASTACRLAGRGIHEVLIGVVAVHEHLS